MKQRIDKFVMANESIELQLKIAIESFTQNLNKIRENKLRN